MNSYTKYLEESALTHGKRHALLIEVERIRKENPVLPIDHIYEQAYKRVMRV